MTQNDAVLQINDVKPPQISASWLYEQKSRSKAATVRVLAAYQSPSMCAIVDVP